MAYSYGILGAGRQGAAAAYDLARFGGAEQVVLFDLDLKRAQEAAERVNRLASASVARAARLDASDHKGLTEAIEGLDALLSAVPYRFNVEITKAAIEARVPLCDLGGSTETVFKQLELDEAAKRAGVAIVPDCGLAPGTANVLARYAMGRVEALGGTPRKIKIYCGGLPQRPKPPLDYQLLFSVEGLLNEYLSPVHLLREGRVRTLEALCELEMIEFPDPVGRCEAFLTSGGTSICPWRFEGQLQTYEYKTVRYPGHCEKIKLLRDLGLLDEQHLDMKGVRLSPRELFQTVAAPRLDLQEPDVVVLRVICRGEDAKNSIEVRLDLMDFYDEQTGFTAMERTTGFSAGIVMRSLAEGEIPAGVQVPDEALSTESYVNALLERGFQVRESVRRLLLF